MNSRNGFKADYHRNNSKKEPTYVGKWRKKWKRRRRRSTGTVCISIIVVVFVAVMAIQIYQLRQKDADYMARENELKEQYEQETQRSSEIDDLEKYMQSSEYYEDVAKSKLGLTYKNEIIFKESEK